MARALGYLETTARVDFCGSQPKEQANGKSYDGIKGTKGKNDALEA
jgi:hypothetical protein